MRNTSKYPITTKEVCEILQRHIREIHESGVVGDVRPMALLLTSAFLELHEEEFNAFLKEKCFCKE